MGCCIRDVLGALVKAKSTSFHPKVAEAFALWEVLKWLSKEGQDNMRIELECKQVVDALHKDKNSLSNFVILISSCKNIVL